MIKDERKREREKERKEGGRQETDDVRKGICKTMGIYPEEVKMALPEVAGEAETCLGLKGGASKNER